MANKITNLKIVATLPLESARFVIIQISGAMMLHYGA
jgi:hypothetical protein